MAQVATTIRMDGELKNQFDRLCEEFGMSINTAFNIFAKAVVRTRSIPFTIECDFSDPAETGKEAFLKLRQQAKVHPEFSMDEINEEIAEYRASKKWNALLIHNLCPIRTIELSMRFR